MNRRDMIKKTVLAMPVIVTLKIGQDAMGNQGSNNLPSEVESSPAQAPPRRSWLHRLFCWAH